MQSKIEIKCGLGEKKCSLDECRDIKSKEVYLDNSATTKMKKEVIDEMLDVMENIYGNPSSIYYIGALAKEKIEEARKKMAVILKVKPSELYFTASGTEADNLAIMGIARANRNKGNHIITSKIEHKAILNACKFLEKEGFEVTYLDVDKNGRVNIDQLIKSMKKSTILVSIMKVNNEIGTIQDMEQIGKIVKYKGAIFHSDFVQTVGHLDIDLKNIDSISISAHKFGGPKGVGMLYVSEKVDFNPIIFGGMQERKKRAGTENVSGIVAMAKAFEIANQNLQEKNDKIAILRDYLKSKLLSIDSRIKINCDSIYKSSGNLNICIDGYNSKDMVLRLNMYKIYVSSGSACNSSEESASHVLVATGISEKDARCSIRFSLSDENTKEEIDYVISCIKEILKIGDV